MAGKGEAFSTKNYSMEANYQALEDLIEGNPELWTDKYLLGTGAQMLRVIAAAQSANGVRTLQALYETYIGYMQRRDSILGYGETMGFSAFRGSNDILEIVAVADQTLSIPARSIVGNVQGTDLITMDTIVVNEGQTFSFKAKVGNLKTESRSVADSEYKYIRFLSENISDDVLFYINDELTEYVTSYKDAFSTTKDFDTTKTAYVMLTNAYGSVDVFIVSKDVGLTVDPANVFTLNFIEYTNLNYTEGDIVFSYGDILKVTQDTIGEPAQSVESLRACIPYFRDTQREVLANRDPIKVLRLLMPNVENTSGTNLNSVHSLLTYKYPDYHLVEDAKLRELEPSLAPIYYFGFCPSNIVQPIQFNTDLDIEVVVFSPKTQVLDVKLLIDNILKQYEYLPELSSINFTTPIDLDTIESEINKLQIDDTNIIKTAYVNVHTHPVTDNITIRLGEYYTENENTYRVEGFNYKTSATMPTDFSEKYTRFGNVLLEKWRLIWGYKELTPDTWYTPDTIVGISNTENFRVHPYYVIPSREPDWNTEIGKYTFDNDMIWLTIDLVPGTPYTVGDYAIKGKIVTPTNSKVSYQLIGFYKKANSILTEDIITTPLDSRYPRQIYNLWNSYTIWSINHLDIHT